MEQEESTEYETDSEDEINARQLLKPVFVTKAEREVHRLKTCFSHSMHCVRALVLYQQTVRRLNSHISGVGLLDRSWQSVEFQHLGV